MNISGVRFGDEIHGLVQKSSWFFGNRPTEPSIHRVGILFMMRDRVWHRSAMAKMRDVICWSHPQVWHPFRMLDAEACFPVVSPDGLNHRLQDAIPPGWRSFALVFS
jgi:hypothetical protein